MLWRLGCAGTKSQPCELCDQLVERVNGRVYVKRKDQLFVALFISVFHKDSTWSQDNPPMNRLPAIDDDRGG